METENDKRFTLVSNFKSNFKLPKYIGMARVRNKYIVGFLRLQTHGNFFIVKKV